MQLIYNGNVIEFEVKKSKRKKVSIYVYPDGAILVRAPLFVTRKELLKLVEKKAEWMLVKQKEAIEKTKQRPLRVYSEEEKACYKKQLKEIIQKRVEFYSVYIPEAEKINRIVIKEQKKRWGSCSSKGNLNFNWKLIFAPPEIIDYVVVHEMCHLKHMNHSKDFWWEVEQILPDYKERRKWLMEHGGSLG